MKPLVDKAEISHLQYDSYQAAARVAESELRAAQEKLSSAQQNAAIEEGRRFRRPIEGQYGPGAGGNIAGQPQAGGRAPRRERHRGSRRGGRPRQSGRRRIAAQLHHAGGAGRWCGHPQDRSSPVRSSSPARA